MGTSPIAVTGSTGRLGGRVARHLAEAGATQRLLVRDPGRALQLPDSSVHPFSYTDRQAATSALDGVAVLFMVSAPESQERLDLHRSFIDAAAAAGVPHIVYTSFVGAAADATFTLARDHHVTEEHIKASGMRWTFLRDSFYLDLAANLAGDDGVIRGPAGQGRCAFVAHTDVARTAAAVLLSPEQHQDRQYDLTGPQALTLVEVAETVSAARGRSVVFHDETIEEAYASRAGYGAPDWQLDAWVSTYTAIAGNVMAPVSPAIEDITGTAPMSLAEYLKQD
ncbi:SDR family oxidoreductase [Kineosporia sp. NBRC 101731]|uniref:SDR family oxidoreductase n=1 Tax=Kineosporia sp. NBRC 101731 TaxID=3032199 RepID=UPI0024A092AF|nr:SDR family oxidoreductase [Kineosporia sp. NBRC 101731]GLY30480.1 NAD(P)-dependent oxidoreductase [Kineosporia sp. NBRC 101731]